MISSKFVKKRFRDCHPQIPDFAFLKFEGEKFEEIEWFELNPWVYVLYEDYKEKEFNPNLIINKTSDEFAIILIKGNVNSHLVCDYNFLNCRVEIIIEGNVETNNLIADKDYFYIGGNLNIKDIILTSRRSEVVVEGETQAKLGIAHIDYSLFSKSGINIKNSLDDGNDKPKWDEPYPRNILQRFLSNDVLLNYEEIQGLAQSWYAHIDVFKLYNALKSKSVLKTTPFNEYDMPVEECIFDYSKIKNKENWQTQKDNFLKLTSILKDTDYKSIHFDVGDNHVTYLKEWGRNNLPHFVVKIPDIGALSITYSNVEPNFIEKLMGNKEPEGMVAVLVHGPKDVVTQLWVDDCKVISGDKFNEIWLGILHAADAGIFHKAQLEKNITLQILSEILDSKYVADNFNSGMGNSLINDENYYQFNFQDEKFIQIGYEASEDGYDARFKYIIDDNNGTLKVQQFIKEFDPNYFHTYFEDIPILHWQSFVAAQRWFEWGSAYLKFEQKEWDKHIQGFSQYISCKDFDDFINSSAVDGLFANSNDANWSEEIEFEFQGNNYFARFFRANDNCSRSCMRFRVCEDEDEFHFSLIKIGTTITANDIDFNENKLPLVELIDEYYFEKARNEFSNFAELMKAK